uniref:Uncharacterized protein n=1 Tax=Prolemur simus TaxID=1328070 RepID=A0A8C8ZSS0_PROSS
LEARRWGSVPISSCLPGTRSAMSRQGPLSLSDLAARSLLSDEDSALRALGEFPAGLFLTLSTTAFDGGHAGTVTAMVQAWPFPCLRLGSLRDQSVTQDLLEAVLDGLQCVPRPRRAQLTRGWAAAGGRTR